MVLGSKNNGYRWKSWPKGPCLRVSFSFGLVTAEIVLDGVPASGILGSQNPQSIS